MGIRVLVVIAVLMLSACGKEKVCASIKTQESLADFVKQHIRDHLPAGGYDPFNSGLVKNVSFAAFEAIRTDEDRARTSCRALIGLEVEGTKMQFPFEYDLLPVGGEGNGEPDTVVAVQLPLGNVSNRIKNGTLANIRKKESEISGLEQRLEMVRRVYAAMERTSDRTDPFQMSLMQQTEAALKTLPVELSNGKEDLKQMRDALSGDGTTK